MPQGDFADAAPLDLVPINPRGMLSGCSSWDAPNLPRSGCEGGCSGARGSDWGANIRAVGVSSPMAQRSPGSLLHPRCPSRAAPKKDTQEPGSALKSGQSFYFIYVQLASARPAKSLGTVLGRVGAGDGAHPAPPRSRHRPLLREAKREGAAPAPGSPGTSTGPVGWPVASGFIWVLEGLQVPPLRLPMLHEAKPSAPSPCPGPRWDFGGRGREPVAGQPPLQRRAGPTMLVACGISLRIQRCVAPGTAWSRGSWA